jgi:hypothetical protein
VSANIEFVATAFTPSSVPRLPAKKSLPGQETWSQATMLNSTQPPKSSPSSSYAVGWPEQVWRLALVLHAAAHGTVVMAGPFLIHGDLELEKKSDTNGAAS